MSELETIRQQLQQLDPLQLQIMLSDFVDFLQGQQKGTIAADAEYSTEYSEWGKSLDNND